MNFDKFFPSRSTSRPRSQQEDAEKIVKQSDEKATETLLAGQKELLRILDKAIQTMDIDMIVTVSAHLYSVDLQLNGDDKQKRESAFIALASNILIADLKERDGQLMNNGQKPYEYVEELIKTANWILNRDEDDR